MQEPVLNSHIGQGMPRYGNPVFAVLVSVGIIFSGCSSGQSEPETPATSENEIELPADPVSSIDEIRFTAYGDWNATVSYATRSGENPDWLYFFPTEGKAGDYLLKLIARPNSSGESRTAFLEIHEGEKTETFTVKQPAAAAVTPEKEVYEIMPDCRSLDVKTTAGSPFRTLISSDGVESPSWIRLAGNPSGSVISFSVETNDRLFPRTALVEFLSQESDRKLGYCIIRQAGIRTIEGHEALEIPDMAFREYLLRNHDTDSNGEITRIELGEISYMDCSGLGIESMSGIEYCSALTYLDCSRNNISSLDITGCDRLEVLRATDCRIPSICLSRNKRLKEIWLDGNPLETLVLGSHPELYRMVVSDTMLASLDVSGFGSLEYLSANNCRLTSINLEGCRKLKSAYMADNDIRHLDLRSLPSLPEYGANATGNMDMESVYADVTPSITPNRLVVLWYTESSKHCVYKPFLYVKGELVSQQIDLGLDVPID